MLESGASLGPPIQAERAPITVGKTTVGYFVTEGTLREISATMRPGMHRACWEFAVIRLRHLFCRALVSATGLLWIGRSARTQMTRKGRPHR